MVTRTLTELIQKENARVRREWDVFEREVGRAPFDELPKTAQRAAIELAERQGDRVKKWQHGR